MCVRSLCFVVASGAIVSVASAGVTETLTFRQTAVRARSGDIAVPTVDSSNNTDNNLGSFNDSRSANAPGTGASTENVSQVSSIINAFYTGVMHADGHASGNSGGTSDSSSSYGSSPSFQSTFTVSFTVDALTHAHFFGTAASTSSGGGSSGLAQILLGDVLGGVPQGTTILAQPSSNSGTTNFDMFIDLLPGHSYSFVATTSASTNRTFASGAGDASADINFTAAIPAPGSVGLMALGGLVAMRRRR